MIDCPDCDGTGMLRTGQLIHIPGEGTTQGVVLCDRCAGTGTSPAEGEHP
jgi:DnaJ-class molecular chaperone